MFVRKGIGGVINMGAFLDDTSDEDSSADFINELPPAIVALLKQQPGQGDSQNDNSSQRSGSLSDLLVCRDDYTDQPNDRFSNTEYLARLNESSDNESLNSVNFGAGVTSHSDDPVREPDSAAQREVVLSQVERSMNDILTAYLRAKHNPVSRDSVQVPKDLAFQTQSGHFPASLRCSFVEDQAVLSPIGSLNNTIAPVVADQKQQQVVAQPGSSEDSVEDLQLVDKLHRLFQQYLTHLIEDRQYVENARDTRGYLTDGASKIKCTKHVLETLIASETNAQAKINKVQTYLSHSRVQKKLIQNCDAGWLLLKAISCLLVLPPLMLVGYSQIKNGTWNFFKSTGRRTLEEAENLLVPPRARN